MTTFSDLLQLLYMLLRPVRGCFDTVLVKFDRITLQRITCFSAKKKGLVVMA